MQTLNENEIAQLLHVLAIRKEDLEHNYTYDDVIKKLCDYIRVQARQHAYAKWYSYDFENLVNDTLELTIIAIRNGTVIDLETTVFKKLRKAMESYDMGQTIRHRRTVMTDEGKKRPRQFDPIVSMDAENAAANVELNEALLDKWQHPEETMINNELCSEIEAARSILKPIDNYIIEECEINERSNIEVAAELNLTSDNVSKRKQRAFIKLKAQLGHDFLNYYQL